MLVRIDRVSEQQLLKSGVIAVDANQYGSLLSLVRDTALVLLTPAEHQLLLERGYKAAVVATDTSAVQLVRRALYGPAMRLQKPYHSYKRVVQELDSLQRAFPSLLRIFSIGKSLRQRDIVAVKISSPKSASAGGPAILFDGCHHADELLGCEISLAVINTLVSEYGKDPEITGWLDHLQIFVVTVVNVDGHEVVTSGE
jgi:murein tripeptide amidase MpaA